MIPGVFFNKHQEGGEGKSREKKRGAWKEDGMAAG